MWRLQETPEETQRVGVLQVKILAIIPARANSTRVPHKNTMRLGPDAKPNFVRAIEVIQQSWRSLPICVVSDDPAVFALAEHHDVTIVKEPAVLVKTGFAIDLMHFGVTAMPGDWDVILLITPNVPIRPSGLVDTLIDCMERTGCDTVSTMVRVPSHYHPYLMAHHLPDGQIREYCPAPSPMNSQDYPSMFVFSSGGELLRTAAVDMLCANRRQAVETLDRRAIVYDPEEVVEIDTPLDVRWAQFLESQPNAGQV